MPPSAAAPARLIVNADDFGYFANVTRGILHCADAGVVTAVGVMANGEAFDFAADSLRTRPDLDAGIHLNLSYGSPLTPRMAGLLSASGGQFRPKFSTMLAVQRGAIPLSAVEHEWRAQIRRCLDAGIVLRFVNSHEHVHMLPRLQRIAGSLAREFSIPVIRRTRPEWIGRWSAGSIVRNVALAAIGLGSGSGTAPRIEMRGVTCSGRLNERYLAMMLREVRAGHAYELMCHPGFPDDRAMSDPALARYHSWQQETDTLCAPSFPRLLQDFSVRLARFRDLTGVPT
jgi:predicted glycoside hydrolase/deacetylase ChbG (UPF0249 family)